MKTKHLLTSLGLGLGLILALFYALESRHMRPGVAQAAVLGPSGPSLRTCWVRLNDDPTDYTTVQAAVDAAEEGDTIKVAGYCTGVEGRPRRDVSTTGIVTQVVYISKTVTVRGGYTLTNWTTSNPDIYTTTLDADGEGRVLYITGQVSPTVEGLQITGGYALDLGGAPPSKGWPCVGGGVYIITATATLIDNQIVDNRAFDGGGGLFLLYSNAVIEGNSIVSNGSLQGGGLCLLESNPTLIGNTIAGNDAWHGGGLWVEETEISFSGNQVISNSAQGCGGGLDVRDSAGELTNNVIADNHAGGYNDECDGGGLYVASSQLHFLHNTIARNAGGDGSGVRVSQSAVWMTNTILVSHTVGISVTTGSTTTLEATLWGTGTWANGTDWGGPGTIITGSIDIWEDPCFVNPDAADYHICSSSAAIDAGMDARVTSDIDGQPRPWGTASDLGADEVIIITAVIYLPAVMR
jgi:hypothetical protein